MTEAAAEKQFAIQRVYTKDISFETPHSPEIFTQQWQPEINIDLNTSSKKLNEGVYEIAIALTVTCKVGEKTAYLAEVQQAGIFTIVGFDAEEMGPMVNSFCPNILFPYARECISDLVNRGSFPQLVLAPINFDAIYAQHLERQQQQAAGAEKH